MSAQAPRSAAPAPGAGELHGYTVVVSTRQGALYVGRCDELCEGSLRLLDAAVLPAGDEASRLAFLERAAERGIWKQLDRAAIPLANILEVRWLGDPAWRPEAAAKAPEGAP